MSVSWKRTALAAALIALVAVLMASRLGSDPNSLTTSEDAEPDTIDSTEDASEASSSTVTTTSSAEAQAVANPQAVAGASVQAEGPFTGDAEVDLPADADDVIVLPDIAGGILQPDLQPPIAGLDTPYAIGWDIKDLRFRYLPGSDELVIAVNSFGVVGDPDGNGNPSTFNIDWERKNVPGTDVPDLGINEAVSIGLDLDSDGTYDAIVGTHIGNTRRQIGVYEFFPAGVAAPLTPIAYGIIGGADPEPIGSLAVTPISPSLDSPDLVFSIADFSTLPGNDGSLDFGVNVRMGSIADGNVGEDSLGDFSVPVPVDVDASIGDLVWWDRNADGIQDDGEPGIGGIGVELLDATGSSVATTATDETGYYRFDVAPGTYVVSFDIPSGDTVSPQNAGADPEKDSNVDPLTAMAPAEIVGPGDIELGVDAGIIRFVPAPSIDIEKATNGVDADQPSGPMLRVGSEVRFTYAVANTGNVPLTNVIVTDDRLPRIVCPTADLVVGGSMTCWADDIVTPGAYRNVGSVVGTPNGDGAGLGDVSDSDPSNHFGVAASIDIEKSTNGEDADVGPGPELTVGEDATFLYLVTNTGNVDLVDITVDDDVLGSVCEIDLLGPGQSESCEAVAPVVEGEYMNLGSVEGIVAFTRGNRVETVTDSDPSHHVGVPGGPECVAERAGPRLFHGGQVVDETGLHAAAGSTIIIVTSEPGDSPDQPNEQVYVQVGDDLYGPTPIELGTLQFTVENAGLVTIVHHSVVTGDISRPNSVEYTWCGTDLIRPTVHTCDAAATGPRLHRYGQTEWVSGLEAAPASTVTITTSEPGDSPGQPHEQVYVQIGDELYGPTPVEHGAMSFTTVEGGLVTVHHYSVFNEDAYNSNSVEFELCGTELYVAR